MNASKIFDAILSDNLIDAKESLDALLYSKAGDALQEKRAEIADETYNQTCEGKDCDEALDPVDKKALKGKHKDREDKDIDNDGDVDSSDKYLHKRRKAISKAVKEEKKKNDPRFKERGKHDCATHVNHEQFGEGTCIHSQHAAPDENGNIAWYDVMFEHGIEKGVPITELKVTASEMHEDHDHDIEESSAARKAQTRRMGNYEYGTGKMKKRGSDPDRAYKSLGGKKTSKRSFDMRVKRDERGDTQDRLADKRAGEVLKKQKERKAKEKERKKETIAKRRDALDREKMAMDRKKRELRHDRETAERT